MKLTEADLTGVEEITVAGGKCYLGTVLIRTTRHESDLYVAFRTYRHLDNPAAYGVGSIEEEAVADLLRIESAAGRDQDARAFREPGQEAKRAAVEGAAGLIAETATAEARFVEGRVMTILADLYDIAFSQGGAR